jgi:hypothetical protein
MQINVKFEDLFTYPTVASLAAKLSKKDLTVADQLPPVTAGSHDLTQSFPGTFEQTSIGGVLTWISYLRGPLDIYALKRALEKMIDRQWALKTRLFHDGTKVFQAIIEGAPLDFKVISTQGQEKKGDEILELTLWDAFESTLDSMDYTLVSFRLIDDGFEEHYLCCSFHHSIFDGYSYMLFKTELYELYSAELENRPHNLPPLPVQYVDYSKWQHDLVSDPALLRRLDFWKKQLVPLKGLQLPIKLTPEEKARILYHEGALETVIKGSLFKKLNEFSNENGLSLNTILLAAFTILLHRIGKEDIFSFCLASAQRPSGMENVMGCVFCHLPFLVNFSDKPTTKEILRRVNEHHIKVQGMQIPELYTVEMAKSDYGRLSFLKVEFNSVSVGLDEAINLPGIVSESVVLEDLRPPHPLYFNVHVRSNRISFFVSVVHPDYQQQQEYKVASLYLEILEEIVRANET